jgi:DoxX-like family
MARRYAYWICTCLLALWLTPSGVLDMMLVPGVVKILGHLGYPAYLGPVLGVAKLLAIAAILYPRTRILREWAYAGITIDLLGAFVSHSAVHDPMGTRITPLVVLALAAGSYLLRPERFRLHPVPDSTSVGSLSAR